MIKTEKSRSVWKGNMRVEGYAGNHTVVIDQPSNMGGSDAGPNPLEALLISLGSCLCMVAAIVARQERIDLRDISVEVEGDYDVDFLMGKSQDGRSGFIEIREKVRIDADLSDEEKVAFYEKVHSRCPVTGSILDNTPIEYDVK